MATFDDLIQKAVEDGDLPGLVLVAKDKTGNFNYAKAIGHRSLEPGNEQPMQLDSVLKLASSSKLLTTIAVLQVIERGLIGWDEDVAQYVPVLAEQEILTGFAWYGKPFTKKREKPITLRGLLTQTAGAGYDFLPIHPLWRWRWWHKQPIGQGNYIDDRCAYPMLHEPGEGWTYGSGITWAGKVLEKVTGMTLEDWIAKHMCEPLGLTSVTFLPFQKPGVASRMASMSWRSKWTKKVVYHPGHNLPESEKECMGGEGAYASLEDYMAIIYSLLVDDEKLLKKETTAKMFQPQLNDVERTALRECLDNPVWICTTILKKDEYDWGIGGVLIDGEGHEYLNKGTLMWSGYYHVLWWIDRTAGVCGVFGAQVTPGTDKIVVPLISAFQREVYDRLNREERQVERNGKREFEKHSANTNGSSRKTQCEVPESPSSTTGRLLAWGSSFWRHE